MENLPGALRQFMCKLPFVFRLQLIFNFALLSAACAPAANSSTPVCIPGGGAASDTQQTLGTLNGAPIAMADVRGSVAGELDSAENEYLQQRLQLTWIATEQLIDDRLLAAAAQKEGISVEELRRREIDDKIEEPSTEAARTLYDANREMIGVDFEVAAPFLKSEMIANEQRRLERDLLTGLRQAAEVELTLPVPEFPRVAVEDGGAPVFGPADAPVTVVVFSDFQCPYCAKARPILYALQQRFPDQLRVVFRDFPLRQHPRARAAAEAAQCANEQGKFWPFHDLLFDNSQALTDDDLRRYASQLGLDTAKLDDCLKSDRPGKLVEAHLKAGEQAGVDGTPSIFINGVKLIGLLPNPIMEAIVEKELKLRGQR